MSTEWGPGGTLEDFLEEATYLRDQGQSGECWVLWQEILLKDLWDSQEKGLTWDQMPGTNRNRKSHLWCRVEGRRGISWSLLPALVTRKVAPPCEKRGCGEEAEVRGRGLQPRGAGGRLLPDWKGCTSASGCALRRVLMGEFRPACASHPGGSGDLPKHGPAVFQARGLSLKEAHCWGSTHSLQDTSTPRGVPCRGRRQMGTEKRKT